MDNSNILCVLAMAAYILVWAFGILLSLSECFLLGCLAAYFHVFGFLIGLVYIVFGFNVPELLVFSMCTGKR